MKTVVRISLVALAVAPVFFAGCKTQPNTAVQYHDAGSVNPLSTNFTLSDLNIIADKMVNSMLVSPSTVELTSNGRRPILVVDDIQNRTDQHIDTRAITDSIRTQLIRAGKFRFVDKPTRGQQLGELNFQATGGMVDPAKAMAIGKQSGAEYMVVGSIVSWEERTSKTVRKSYKFTMNLIDLTSGIIEWADEVPISKQSSKAMFGY